MLYAVIFMFLRKMLNGVKKKEVRSQKKNTEYKEETFLIKRKFQPKLNTENFRISFVSFSLDNNKKKKITMKMEVKKKNYIILLLINFRKSFVFFILSNSNSLPIGRKSRSILCSKSFLSM